MMNRATAGSRVSKRVVSALLASAFLMAGSPVAASAAGASPRPVSAGFGDCKNTNSGKHNGYVCPSDNGGGGVLVF